MAIPLDRNSLDDIALRAGADIRLPLLRTLVDLYLQKPAHTSEEAQHFTELTLRLLDAADVSTRVAVARRLAAYPAVPAAISLRLANDVPNVCGLRRSAASGHIPVQPRVSPVELTELFFAASAAERRLILVNLAFAPAPATPASLRQARDAARRFETAALARNTEAFIRALERWLDIGPVLARRIALDPLGEPVVVAAKVLGIATDALQRVLLFVNPTVGRSVYRVHELAMLFDTIEPRAARALAGIWRSADPPSAGKPAPADFDAVGRRAPASRGPVTQSDATSTARATGTKR